MSGDAGGRDGVPVTRRKLLSGVAAAGGAGALTGLGTGALLADREDLMGTFLQSGQLDLAVGWERPGGATDAGVGRTTIDVGPLGDGESGWAKLTVDLPQGGVTNNPAYVWFRTLCPEPINVATEQLSVALWYADCDDGSRVGTEPIVDGPLCEVADSLRGGVPLDGDPTTPGRDCLDTTAGADPLCLRFEWSLDAGYEGEESTTVEFEFVGTQCRHDDGTTSPWADAQFPECECIERRGISWIRVWACNPDVTDECVCDLVGKFELDGKYADCSGATGLTDNYVEPGLYDLFHDDDCEDTGYDLDVVDTRWKGDGEDRETTAVEFLLLEDDGTPGPELCLVEIKAGSTVVSYGPEDLVAHGTDGLLEAPLVDEGGSSGGGSP